MENRSPTEGGELAEAASQVVHKMNKDKERFQSPDIARDAEALAEGDVSREGLLMLGRAYDKLMLHYYKRKSYLLNPYQSAAKLDMRKRHLLALIQQAAVAGASPEIFLRAQFAQLQQFTEAFPAIQILASDRAPKRYEAYMRRMKETYVSDVQRDKFLSAIPIPATAQTLIEYSVQALLKRLTRVVGITGALPDELYQSELEMMARGGELKPEFIVTLDERWLNNSMYMSALATQARMKHNAAMVASMKALSKRLFMAHTTDERILRYV